MSKVEYSYFLSFWWVTVFVLLFVGQEPRMGGTFLRPITETLVHFLKHIVHHGSLKVTIFEDFHEKFLVLTHSADHDVQKCLLVAELKVLLGIAPCLLSQVVVVDNILFDSF